MHVLFSPTAFFDVSLGACVENKYSNNRNSARKKNQFRLTKNPAFDPDVIMKNVPYLSGFSSMKESAVSKKAWGKQKLLFFVNWIRSFRTYVAVDAAWIDELSVLS